MILERVIRPTRQHIERAWRKLARRTNVTRFLKLADSWKKIHSTKIQLQWAAGIATVLIGIVFLALLADDVYSGLLFGRIVERPSGFIFELLRIWLGVAGFIFAFLRATSIVTSLVHIGKRRLCFLLGVFGASVGVFINQRADGDTFFALLSIVVGFSIAPLLIAEGHRLWIWIEEGFANSNGET